MSDFPRVGVSLLAVKQGMIGGLARYVREVARALAERRADSYVFFTAGTVATYWRSILGPDVQVEAVEADNRSTIRRSLFEIFRLPLHARRFGCDVLFYPNTTAPVSRQATPVVALFDVMYRSQPNDAPAHKKLYLDWCCRTLRRRGTQIVTLSEFSRRDISEHTGIELDRLVAIPCGIDEAFFDDGIRTPLPESLGSVPYLLSVSAAYPHKRLTVAVSAFELVAQDYPELRLVLVGTGHGSVPEQKRLAERIGRSPVRERIVRVPTLSWDALPVVYRGARALVYSSQFEGFGLPVAEAMASGVPIAAAPAEAVVEILDGHGEIAAGWTERQLADALHRVLEWPPELRHRQVASARASVAARFRWPLVAEALEREFQVAAVAGIPR